MKKIFQVLKDFKKINFYGHISVKENYVVINFLPALGYEWDTQCKPVAEDGKIVIDGYRELTIFFEWLCFFCAICFEFDWNVTDPSEFEQKPWTREELKKIEKVISELEHNCSKDGK